MTGGDRRRACRMGSFAYADKHGSFARPQSSTQLVCVRASSVCVGIGVFAVRFIPRGAPITRYSGRLVRSTDALTEEELAYTYHIRRRCNLVGLMKPVVGKGVGSLVNDAIHFELSGRVNNCEYVHHRNNRVYVAASRDIRAGEELLVEYHISYWMGHCRAPRLPENVAHWAACHERLQAALSSALGRCSLEEYLGVKELAEGDCCCGVATYRVSFKDPSRERCACDGHKIKRRLATCEVRLDFERDGGRTSVAWRCLDCGMAAFRHLQIIDSV